MPPLDLHDKLSVELLKQLGVRPDYTLIGLISELIDAKGEEKGELLGEVRRLVDESRLYECEVEWIEVFNHDVEIVKCKGGKARVWRYVFNCLFGEPYGLLVDLHVLLDLADRFYCDERLLEYCYEEIGLDERVWSFYKARKCEIQLKLGCLEGAGESKCGKAMVAREP